MASFTLNSDVDEPTVLAASLDQHEAIVDAIEAGDPEEAEAAMLLVIDTGTARINTHISGRPSKVRSAGTRP